MAVGSYGQTSLHLAAEVGYYRVVQLIEAGASTSAVYCWRPKLDKTLVVCIILFIGFSVVLFGMSSSAAAAAVVVCTVGGLTGFGSRTMKKGRRFVIRMLVKGGGAAGIPVMSNNVLYRITRRGPQSAG